MGFFSTSRPFEKHLGQAKEVLESNWMGSYTRPANGLYPHQWNWDSAFIALGYANYLPQRGRRELGRLFAAQWPNGMVPHIVFNPDYLGGYFPEPDFWQCPQGRQTSGLTMPPLHAEACLRLHRLAHDQESSRGFLAEMFPKLLQGHRYLYRERDPEREGLIYIRHPWESGRDNAPAWDAPLGAIDLNQVSIPAYQRRDLDKGVDQEQRPADEDYDRYVYLVDLFRRLDYDEAAIQKECPFLVQDIGFNSILCRDNRALKEIAGLLGKDQGEIEEWYQQTSRGFATSFGPRITGALNPLICGPKSSWTAPRPWVSCPCTQEWWTAPRAPSCLGRWTRCPFAACVRATALPYPTTT